MSIRTLPVMTGASYYKPRSKGKVILSTKSTGRKLNQRQKRQVKRIVSRRLEKKEFPFFIVNGAASSAGTIVDLSAIPVNTGNASRIGNAVTLKNIEFRFSFAAADATQVCRLIIFQWKNDSGPDPPSVAELIQDTVNNPWLGDYRYDERTEFNILYDGMLFLDTTGNGVGGTHIIVKSRKYKKDVDFNTGATTGNNKIYALYISDSSAVTHPVFNMYGTITYTDA